jgi:hypothetical protein
VSEALDEATVDVRSRNRVEELVLYAEVDREVGGPPDR